MLPACLGQRMRLKRRDFTFLVGGTLASWPLVAHAQRPIRRIGVLMAHAEDDAEFKAYVAAFRDGLEKLGWSEGLNIHIDFRWGALDDAAGRERSAKELLTLQPEVILMQNTPPTGSMLQQTRTIPVVFVIVADPVGSGFVESLARPGGNATGFTIMEPSISGKWVELLKEIAPRVIRVAVLFNPATTPYAPIYLKPFKAAATSLGLQAMDAPVHSVTDLESIVAAESRMPNGGLVVIPDGFLNVHRAESGQLENRKGPWPRRALILPAARRRRDRIAVLCGRSQPLMAHGTIQLRGRLVRSWRKLTWEPSGGIRVLTQPGREPGRNAQHRPTI
jgi:putative tryptophan/tyrosine transport system substrate-binding protein